MKRLLLYAALLLLLSLLLSVGCGEKPKNDGPALPEDPQTASPRGCGNKESPSGGHRLPLDEKRCRAKRSLQPFRPAPRGKQSKGGEKDGKETDSDQNQSDQKHEH